MLEKNAARYAERIREQLGNHVLKVVLFGSRSRSDAKTDSDYDFLVVVDKKTEEIENSILENEVLFLNNNNVMAGTILYDSLEWDRAKRFPIGRNIMKDGIEL